jgi:hypothetical protein
LIWLALASCWQPLPLLPGDPETDLQVRPSLRAQPTAIGRGAQEALPKEDADTLLSPLRPEKDPNQWRPPYPGLPWTFDSPLPLFSPQPAAPPRVSDIGLQANWTEDGILLHCPGEFASVEISPSVDGTWQSITPRLQRFKAEGPLPRETELQLKVRMEGRGALEARLPPLPLKLEWTQVEEGSLQPVLRLCFNGKPGAVKLVLVPAGGRPVEMEPYPSEENEDAPQCPEEGMWAARPVSELPVATEVRATVDSGGSTHSFSFHTPPALRILSSTCRGDCREGVAIELSTAVDAQDGMLEIRQASRKAALRKRPEGYFVEGATSRKPLLRLSESFDPGLPVERRNVSPEQRTPEPAETSVDERPKHRWLIVGGDLRPGSELRVLGWGAGHAEWRLIDSRQTLQSSGRADAEGGLVEIRTRIPPQIAHGQATLSLDIGETQLGLSFEVLPGAGGTAGTLLSKSEMEAGETAVALADFSPAAAWSEALWSYALEPSEPPSPIVGYSFSSSRPEKGRGNVSGSIQARTDEAGRTAAEVSLPKGLGQPHILRLSAKAGTETLEEEAWVHPSSAYVGLKIPDSAPKGGDLTVEAVAIDHAGNPSEGLALELRRSGPDGDESCLRTSSATPVSCIFRPESVGTNIVSAIARDEKGRQHSIERTLFVYGAPGRRTEAEAAFSSDNSELVIQAPFLAGDALVGIEGKSSSVAEHVEIDGGYATIEVPSRIGRVQKAEATLFGKRQRARAATGAAPPQASAERSRIWSENGYIHVEPPGGRDAHVLLLSGAVEDWPGQPMQKVGIVEARHAENGVARFSESKAEGQGLSMLVVTRSGSTWQPLARPEAPRSEILVPESLRLGDWTEAKAFLYNPGPEELQASVAMESAGPQIGLDAQGVSLRIRPYSVQQVSIPIHARELGQGRIRASIEIGGKSTHHEIALPVRSSPGGLVASSFAELDFPADQSLSLQFLLPAGEGEAEIFMTMHESVSLLIEALGFLYIAETPARRADRLLVTSALWNELYWTKSAPFDELRRLAAGDLEALARLQDEDGGWGSEDLTLHAMHALIRAQQEGLGPPYLTMVRGIGWLEAFAQTQMDADAPSSGKLCKSLYLLHQASNGSQSTAVDKVWEEGIRLWDEVDSEGKVWLVSILGEREDPRLLPTLQRWAASWDNSQSNKGILVSSLRDVKGTFNMSYHFTMHLQATHPLAIVGMADHLHRKKTPETSLRLYSWVDGRRETDGYLRWIRNQPIPWSGPLDPEKPTDVRFTASGAGRMRYGMLLHRSAPRAASESGGVLARSYEAMDDPDDVQRLEDGSWRIQLGARIRVNLYATAPGKESYRLRDSLPAGLEESFSPPEWAASSGLADGDPWIEVPSTPRPMLWSYEAVARHSGSFHAPSALLNGEGIGAESSACRVEIFRPPEAGQ